MTDTELAKAMLDWQDAQATADSIKVRIEVAILERGKTQTVGNVRASYSAGRKSYDYQAALSFADEEALLPWTTEIPASVSVDYRAACKGLGVDEIPFTQSEPRVTVKLI